MNTYAGAVEKNKSLRRRFTAVFAIAYITTGVVAIFALRPVLDAVIFDLGVKFATERVLLEKAILEGVVDREIALSRALADDPATVQFCVNENDGPTKERGLAVLAAFRYRFRDQSSFVIVDRSRHYYFDDKTKTNGPEIIYTIDSNKREDAWYEKTMQTVDTYGLNLDRDVVLDTTKVWINTIVHHGPDKVGLAGTGIDISEFTRALIRDSNDAVSVIVVDKDGVLQAHRDQKLLERNAKAMAEGTIKATIYELVGDELGRHQLRGELQKLREKGGVSAIKLDIEGKSRLVAAAYIKELGWFDMVLVDTSLVVGGSRFAPLFLVGIALVLLMTIAVGVLLNRWVLSRLAQLMKSTLDIAGGHYGAVIEIDQHDEIGALADAFNRMSKTVAEHTQDLEQKVADRTEQLVSTNSQLAEVNRKLLSSIDYAKLIQASILPRELSSPHIRMTALWLPKDLVSGDFYSFRAISQNTHLIGIFDCTGHGVPGAFMTMTANAALMAVVESTPDSNPSQMLKDLHHRVRTSLQQETIQEIDNGLDAALVLYNSDSKVLQFSGAKIGLFQISDGQIIETKPDRYGVGYARLGDGRPYSLHSFQCAPNTTYCLTTDGLLDEPEETSGNLFSKRRLFELLLENRRLPIEEQKQAIYRALLAHRGSRPQRDDITVILFNVS